MLIFLRTSLLLILAALLSGCPVSESVVIYNNSNSDVVVQLENYSLNWKMGHKITISESGSEIIKWEDLKWVGDPSISYTPTLIFMVGGEVLTLNLTFPRLSDEYISESGAGRKYHLQLDQNGVMYIVSNNSSYPVLNKNNKIELKFMP